MEVTMEAVTEVVAMVEDMEGILRGDHPTRPLHPIQPPLQPPLQLPQLQKLLSRLIKNMPM